jgi:hypothetical protein
MSAAVDEAGTLKMLIAQTLGYRFRKPVKPWRQSRPAVDRTR